MPKNRKKYNAKFIVSDNRLIPILSLSTCIAMNLLTVKDNNFERINTLHMSGYSEVIDNTLGKINGKQKLKIKKC